MSEIVRAQSRYLNGLGDRLDAGKEESILGHYIEEKGWAMKRALEHLKPLAREAHEQASKSERYSKWFAVGCGLAGLLGGSSIGVMGMLPLGTAAIAIVLWNQARTCLPRRAAELKALKTLPELPNIAYFAYQGGATEQQIISAWDLFLDGYQKQKPSGVTGQQIESEFKRLLVAVCSESKPPSFDEYDDDETEGNDAAVGATTQLGAIPVPAIAVSNESATPTTYPMAAKEVSKEDRAALVARLKSDCPALLPLIKAQPIRLVGMQRTGKSTIAKIVCLLRMILLPGHTVSYATPHGKIVKERPPKVFRIMGYRQSDGAPEYEPVAREWDRVTAIARANEPANFTAVWDEFGGYNQIVTDREGEKDRLKDSLASMLRESAKIGLRPIYIVHGETLAQIPGIKGFVEQFLAATVRVEAIGEMVEDDIGLGELAPTGRFHVTTLDGVKSEGKIPEWLTESYLLGLIGDQSPPKLEQPERFERKPDRQATPTRRAKITIPTRGDTSAARIEKLRSELERLEAYHRLAPLEPDRGGAPFRPITKSENAERIREVREAIDAASFEAGLDPLDDDSIDDDELAIRAEVKRFLIENPDGAKVKDFVNRARKPVRKMPSDDVKFVLELMELEDEIYSVDSNYFAKGN